MKKIEFYTNPSPYKFYQSIKDIYAYYLIIGDDKSLSILYETDTTLPCNKYHINKKFIKETFTLKEFFNLKQGKKYHYVINAQDRLVELLSNFVLEVYK